MKKFFLIILSLCLLASSMLFSQTITLKTFGVSPRQAEADSMDIFERAYNSLLNVGVETQMYLQGMLDGASLSNPTWTVTTAPDSSTAEITTITIVDTSTQVAVFTPDVIGTYVVTFADGDNTASVTINAGTYLGIEDGNCNLCHSDKVAEWGETGHSTMLERGLNGTLSNHYGPNCISCHTTGYDVNANNNGFDDRPFVFPSELVPGMYDSMKTVYPEAMKLANIQCESCHGPASAHFGNRTDSKMVSSLDAQNCAWCHDEGTHHYLPAKWRDSRHANPQHPYTRASCAPCHNGAGFIKFVEGGKVALTEDMPENQPISCAVCHDPHSHENEHQLRTVQVTLGNGVEVIKGGNGKLCMNCHKSRRNAAEYTGPNFKYSSHYGPHHGPQADMLAATNVPTFGKKLPSSPHLSATENACVDCHMAATTFDEAGNPIDVGSHTFWMSNPVTGEDNVAVCQKCHGDIGSSFDEKKYYLNGVADLDGDGVEEGLMGEVDGLMAELALMLPPIDSSAVIVNKPYIYTETEAKAAYNYLFVHEDRSHGVHNPAFAVSLLKVSIQALKNHAVNGDIVEIKDVPNDQGKMVRIIWNKFVDDGIAVDPIATYSIKRFDDDSTAWTTVGELTADGSPRYALEVPTLYDSTASGLVLTKFKVVAISKGGSVYESVPAEGYSIDNLIPAAPQGFLASFVGNEVQLTWEESQDIDFNYYAVYRSVNAGFEISADNLIATTTGTEFADNEIEMENKYYYKVTAFDFSGNESEASDEASVMVTGVNHKKDQSLPTEFSLAQNYPNPFNPTTVIKFGVPRSEQIVVNIYDIRGVHVRTLANGKFSAGYHTLTWDGRDQQGQVVSAGAYLYRLESRSMNISKKMIYLK